MDMIGLVGFVFAVTALGALVHERQMDVLHGSYIEGRLERPMLDLNWEPVRALADRISFRVRNVVYLAALV